ncbi:MAG: hypothetical protein KY445_11225 [Armatimonadetes bacterium]|nr:hypothetical protein [Armatimonadota bacterium]
MALAPSTRRFLSLLALLGGAAALFVTRPRFTPALSERGTDARTATCLSNLNQIARAYALYAHDFDGKIPRGIDPEDRNSKDSPFFNPANPTPYLHEILRPYVASRQVFHCPADVGWTQNRLPNSQGSLEDVHPSSFSKFGTSYYCWTIFGFAQVGAVDLEFPQETILLFDGDLWHGERPGDRLNALFADGHVQNLSPRQFQVGSATPDFSSIN